MSGKRGEGKSTILSQTTLNVIDQGHKVGFYSGELSAFRFQQWLFGQAAGARNMEAFVDEFGATLGSKARSGKEDKGMARGKISLVRQHKSKSIRTAHDSQAVCGIKSVLRL